MATVSDLLRRTLQLLGVQAAGENPKAADMSNALETLNDMLASWAGERLTLHATLRSTHSLTAGLTPHTIGVGGTFNTTRPVRIDRASVIPGTEPGAELPLDLLTDDEWQQMQGKEAEGRPTSVWIEDSYPLMKLHFRPVPVAGDALILYTWQQLGAFASLATSFDLPPGYARAIRYNLAKELAPEYGVSLSAEAADIASESKSTLKRLNHKPALMQCDSAVLGGNGGGRNPLSTGVGGGGGTDSGGLY